MEIYKLVQEQYLPISVIEAWDFFSSAGNLATITPPALGFEILTELDGTAVYDGMRIRYRVRPLLNIPMIWETEITEVKAPFSFKDRQEKGPYALWEHKHTFTPVEGGVKMMDEVSYALPLGWIGRLAHSPVVKKKLDDIFSYRRNILIKLFGELKQ